MTKLPQTKLPHRSSRPALRVLKPTRPHLSHDVLLVDPDDEVRACRALYLQMRGYRVAPAYGATDTLQLLRKGLRPCVVLVDPRASGTAAWVLVDYLRTDSVLARVPLVLITHDRTDVKCAHWRGVSQCILTPASPDGFVAAIEGQCRRLPRAATHAPLPIDLPAA